MTHTLKIIFFLSAFLSACSSPTHEDEFAENADPTHLLHWTGQTHKFSITAQKGIRLNDTQGTGGTAYLSFPSSRLRNARWEFGVNLSFNPSANNHARFYLASSSPILDGELNGYFLQIGGTTDGISLYRQEKTTLTPVIKGRELMKGDSSPEIRIRVECTADGFWTLWTKRNNETDYTREARQQDAHIPESSHCGVYCHYTQSRSRGIGFHHIQLSDEISEADDAEERPDTTALPADTTIAIPKRVFPHPTFFSGRE